MTDRLSPGMKSKLDLLRIAVGLCFCSVMIWKGAGIAWQHNDRMSTTLGTPMVIPYLFLPVGFSLLALQYAARIWARKEKSPTDPTARHPLKTDREAGQQI